MEIEFAPAVVEDLEEFSEAEQMCILHRLQELAPDPIEGATPTADGWSHVVECDGSYECEFTVAYDPLTMAVYRITIVEAS